MSKTKVCIVAAVLVVAGVLSMLFLNLNGSIPSTVCADPNGPTSGFTDESKDNCPTTIEGQKAVFE